MDGNLSVLENQVITNESDLEKIFGFVERASGWMQRAYLPIFIKE